MSVIRVAVPVLQGKRRFHFEKGRPWSVLEHLLLAALVKTKVTAKELAVQADVPQRLVVEGLIRLMRAGWIQMHQQSGAVTFEATHEGVVAALTDELPNVARRMSRHMTFVVDQIAGGVFRSRELPYLHTHMVEERAAREPIVWIERPEQVLFDGVQPLVEALFQEDEKFIAMDASGERLAERWSLVTVRDGEVDGLSNRASPQLMGIVKLAAKQGQQGRPQAENRYRAPRVQPSNFALPMRNVAFSANDFILGGAEHQDALLSVLRRARQRVVIHSTFISEARFDALITAFEAAIAHGVQIDIMWGQDQSIEDTRSTRAAVRRLRERIQTAGWERLRIHPFSTRSHCKIIVADEGNSGRYVGFLGSCNWLSTSFQSFEASLRIRDPLLLADVVNQLAELSRGASGNWTNFTGDLAALSAHIVGLKRPPVGQAHVGVVLGPQHADLVRKARDEAKSRIFVTSHRFGLAAEQVVIAPSLAAANDRGIKAEIFYGKASGPITGSDVADVTFESALAGVQIRPIHRPRLHSKILAWDDDTVVITSQNWLSADPPDNHPRQEIGICVQSRNASSLLIDRFNAARIV